MSNLKNKILFKKICMRMLTFKTLIPFCVSFLFLGSSLLIGGTPIISLGIGVLSFLTFLIMCAHEADKILSHEGINSLNESVEKALSEVSIDDREKKLALSLESLYSVLDFRFRTGVFTERQETEMRELGKDLGVLCNDILKNIINNDKINLNYSFISKNAEILFDGCVHKIDEIVSISRRIKAIKSKEIKKEFLDRRNSLISELKEFIFNVGKTLIELDSLNRKGNEYGVGVRGESLSDMNDRLAKSIDIAKRADGRGNFSNIDVREYEN